ncbi:MAG: T9SS type A sorting domain-containing protein [Bacteroidales bacterium]|nr:T9SS type A sorting domain-containing protein [Bacteroidales bacterium]
MKLCTNNRCTYKYTIYDLVGNIKKVGLLNKHENTVLIDVSPFTKGVYLMQISNAYTKKTLKFYKH